MSKKQRPDQDRWTQGYFSAVAVALREDGDTTIVRNLFKQFGDPTLPIRSILSCFVHTA